MSKRILVEVSARHVHLSEAALKKLFGKEAMLHPLRSLSQKGEFASQEEVTLMSGSRSLRARIVGPTRTYNQVELARTDARALGIEPPLRRSGDVAGGATVTIVGPKGKVRLSCAIVQRRHIHVSPKEARALGLRDGKRIRVALGGVRKLIFDEVEVKVAENFHLALHLDTDEANAAGITKKTFARIIA